MIKLDKGSKDPLYLQVKAGLLAQINAGTFTLDQPIPTERELAVTLGLSRLTVRRSIVELAQEGLVRRIPGRGTFITSGVSKPPLSNVTLIFSRENPPEPMVSPFPMHLMNGLFQALHPAALSLRHQPVDFDRLRETQGIVALWALDPQQLRMLIETGIPLVAYECAPDVTGPTYDTINHANEPGSYDAVASLINLGHRDIGCAIHSTSIGQERRAGYERAMRHYGLPVRPERIYDTMPSGEAGYALGLRLLDDPKNAPTALFCSDDSIALGVLSAAHELGLEVPKFISIIGFGDVGLYSTPALSSVRMNIHASGREAIRLLKERAANPSLPSRQLLLPTEYIRRASCGPRRSDS